jgi:Tol biopolymer transport system component
MSAALGSRLLALAAAVGVLCAGSVSAQESIWQKLADFFNMSQSPIQLRSGSGEPVAGEIWLVPAAGGAKTRLTAEGGYSSPVFLPDGKALLALRGDVLVRIDVNGGTVTELARVPGVTRLVGVGRERPDDLAVLAVGDGGPRIDIFERSSGRRRTVRHDPKSSPDRLMLAYVEGDEREYGSVRVFIDDQRTSLRQWTDVFIQTAGRPPVDLTNGNGISSRQPALSHDGALVAYVNVGRGR